MKTFFVGLSMTAMTFSLTAQKDIQLLEREENGLTIISAKNTSKTDYQLTLTIESTGMTVSQPMPYAHLVKAGTTEDLVTLTPQRGHEQSYKASVSYTAANPPITSSPAEPEVKSQAPNSESLTEAKSEIEGIVVYTKPGCGRCTVAKDHLRNLKAQFTEIDITKKSTEVNALWAGLRAQGLKGNSVRTPVIAKDGIYYHEIPDIRTFLDELVSRQK